MGSLRRMSIVALFLFASLAFPVSARAVEVERVVSPGGIEAWLVRDKTMPLVSIEFSFRGGAAYDPPGKAGLANMVAALLDEGAGELDSQAFQRRLEDRAIRLSFGVGMDTFRGSLKTLNRTRDEAVDLLRLALTAPRFDPEPVERVRQQFLSALSRRSTDPGYVAGRVWSRVVFGDHPYARPDDGTEESIKAITVEDLRRFARERFARNLLIVGVVGDIAPKELGALLDRAFGGLPERFDLPALAPASFLGRGDVYVVEKDVPQSTIVFGQPGIARDDPDYYAAYVMNYVLGGGGFSSRLYREVREKRGLVYSIWSYLNPMAFGATIGGGAGTKNENVAETLRLVRAEWTRLWREGVTERELADAKTYLTGSFPLRLTSTDRIARFLVAMQYHRLGIDYLDRRKDLINAVTRGDVARVARKLLDPEKLTIVVVGRPEGVTPTAKAPAM